MRAWSFELAAHWVAALTLVLGAAGAGGARALPPEVQVGTADIGDYEFDWGRDGQDCPTCNNGAGNSRLTFVDSSGNLWVAGVDFATGNFYPTNGKGTLVDTNVARPEQVGNGPEWMFSQRGSELVYTRWTDGLPQQPPNQTLGFARMSGGTWVAGAIPDTHFRQNPEGSLNLGDAVPRIVYTDGYVAFLYWRDMSRSSVEQQTPIPFPPGAPIARRWVPGTTQFIVTVPAAPDDSGVVYWQVFLYDTATDKLEQLTFDPVDKNFAFMWSAPEFGGATVFFTVAGGTTLRIYRQAPTHDGGASWSIVNSITMPSATPYVGSPEPFVHNGRSWVFFWLGSSQSAATASRIAITGIDPAKPSLRMLTSATQPRRSRRDPEYFITANGPYIYYSRYLLQARGKPPTIEGVFRVDTGLGPPTH